jgi:hypothetical protein
MKPCGGVNAVMDVARVLDILALKGLEAGAI